VNVVLGWTHIHFLYAAPILTLLDLLILVGVSARRRVSVSVEGDATMWKVDFQRAERLRLALVPFWQDYRVLAAALLALTAGVVIAFK
jgi:SSS family solute:Na+ symporter